MLNFLQTDIRGLVDLVQKIENFDATLAAARATGKPIEPTQPALDERKSLAQEALQLRAKWAI